MAEGFGDDGGVMGAIFLAYEATLLQLATDRFSKLAYDCKLSYVLLPRSR